MRRRRRLAVHCDPDYIPLAQLWTLRALFGANGLGAFLGPDGYEDRAIAELLGLSEDSRAEYTRASALRRLRRLHATLERRLGARESWPADTAVARNLRLLSERLALDPLEQDVLLLVLIQRSCAPLSDALDHFGELSHQALARLISACIDRPLPAVLRALDGSGRLARTALLQVDARSTYNFGGKVDLMHGLVDAIQVERSDLFELFRGSLAPTPAAGLAMADFEHLGADLEVLGAFLAAAGRERRSGVNVLFHGQPGTGKTQLARALAAHLGWRLFEVPADDAHGKPREGRDRFESYRFAQCLLDGNADHALLFDEVEDVFADALPDGPWGRHLRGNVSGIKGWVNQLLEGNPVPTFWVTNHLESIDPAYRRRFDYVLRLDVPPVSVRRRLVAQHAAAAALPAAWCEQVAQHEALAPALIERAVRVGLAARAASPAVDTVVAVSRALNNTLEALGAARLPQLRDGLCALDYRPDYLNADADLDSLASGLRRSSEGRLCLYGPPGTGKTAWAAHLARTLERPLLVRRASDILSPYVGVAERNIARMFAQAAQEQAVLVFDEADSLLQDRRHAQRSWEVTQVNEMLTQMESFRGIFVASTNLIDSFDEAAMRRFDICIRLGYLGSRQAWEMFVALATSIGFAVPDALRARLDLLRLLTPGDFAAVARGIRLDAVSCAEGLLARLVKVCDAKDNRRQRPIGFVMPT